MEEEQFNKVNEKQIRGSSLIAIRPHFYYQNLIEATKSIAQEDLKKIESLQQQVHLAPINTKSKMSVLLKKKYIQKPLHLLKLRKRINKKTKQVSYKIEQCETLKVLYDYEDMCDFVSSEGGDIIQNDSIYSLNKNELINYVKDKLQDRIMNKLTEHQNEEQNEIFKKLIKPEYFLKKFNLAPPKCDFFVNKVKNKDDKQFNNSLNINYEDPLPTLNVEIPKPIKQTQLFEIIQKYLSKRPCWLKNTLLFILKQDGHTSFTINELKNVLKYLCYTFKNGPWKHTFCLFGYDPRKTFKSVVFQNVSLKLKKKEAEDYEQQIEEEIYDPSFNDISSRCIRAYQIGDIYLQQVKEIIKGKLISEESEHCTKQHGWLTVNEHNHILKAMKEHKDKKNK